LSTWFPLGPIPGLPRDQQKPELTVYTIEKNASTFGRSDKSRGMMVADHHTRLSNLGRLRNTAAWPFRLSAFLQRRGSCLKLAGQDSQGHAKPGCTYDGVTILEAFESIIGEMLTPLSAERLAASPAHQVRHFLQQLTPHYGVPVEPDMALRVSNRCSVLR
jgi:hypothetical protein